MDNSTTTYTKTFSIDLERTNYHLKMKKRKMKRIMLVVILWVLLFIYFITPLSKVNLKVSGNVYYTKEELIKMGYINNKNLWWLFNENNAIKTLESYEYIEDVKIKKSFFGTKMYIKETYPIAKVGDKYLLNTGNLVKIDAYPNKDKIIDITSFDLIEMSDYSYLANKYSRVDLYVRNRIDKVEIIKDSNDYKYIKLYGEDEKIGFFVIKVDLVYLDTKFKENKYNKIIEEISKNNVKYSENKPVFVAYHEYDEESFHVVDSFEEE